MKLDDKTFERLRDILKRRKKRYIYRKGFVNSAVAIINHFNNGEYCLLFTLRSDKVRHHQGQISFPGGRQDRREDLIDCAIRETMEEINVALYREECLGRIDDFLTITRFRVSPYVFFTGKRCLHSDIRPNEEIKEVLNVPVGYLLSHLPRSEVVRYGRLKVVQYFYEYKDYIIWGATGRMLKQYLDILSMCVN